MTETSLEGGLATGDGSRSGRGVRRYMLGLAIGASIPLALFAAFVAYQNTQGQLETIKTSILSTTRAIAVAVDEHVRTRRMMLQELARSKRLQAGDLPGFHEEMVTLSRQLDGTIISLVQHDGTRALFSLVPPESPVPGMADLDLVRRVFDTGEPQISNVFTGSLTQLPFAAIGVPVVIEGRVRYSLQLTLNPTDFIRLLSANALPEPWISGIVDRRGRFLARVPDNERRLGQLASEGWRAVMRQTRDESWDRFDALEGQTVYNGQSPARESGFLVGIGVPAAIIDRPLDSSLIKLSLGGGVLLALGVVIALSIARRLTNGLQQLATAAEQVPTGSCEVPERSGLKEIDQIAIALSASARAIRRRTEERDRAESAMRQSAENLRRVNENLEERVANEIATRMRAEEAFRQVQKMEAIGQLTGGIAHDFNNLLQVIRGNLEVLRERARDHASGLGDEVARTAELALRGAERGAALTHRLLAFARQQPLAPEVLDPNKLVSGMSELIRRTLGETIGIETVLASGIWRIFADSNQLESALLNLAVNARDAMPNGGKLTLETANWHLDEDYVVGQDAVPGQYVMISVTDTGQGIQPGIIDKVFDPFFTTKPTGQGSGLGLSQVYGFVKQSNGHVRIYSEPGAGTSVKIYLPRSTGSETRPGAAETLAVTGVTGAAILVVEDDPDVRVLSIGMLRRLGYDVLDAADGVSALATLRERPDIALLFTDVGLPGPYNGRQLADEATRLRPDLKVLFTTGYAQNAIIHHGRLDPGVALLAKPFGYGALADKLREILLS